MRCCHSPCHSLHPLQQPAWEHSLTSEHLFNGLARLVRSADLLGLIASQSRQWKSHRADWQHALHWLPLYRVANLALGVQRG